jgi:hypothetical protein
MASSSDYKVSQTNHCRLDIQCVEIHNSINTFYTSAHPKDNSCEVSLQWDQNICLTFMVIMATAAFLKTSNPKCTSTHPKDHSCDVQLQSDNNIKIFTLSWLPWKRRTFWKFQAQNKQLHIPRIIYVKFPYNQITFFNWHGYHGNGGHF